MQFQVKGQDYFLAFVEEEKLWYLFAPRAEGLLRIPVYVDAPGAARTTAEYKGTHKLS